MKAIIFDLGNTLVNTSKIKKELENILSETIKTDDPHTLFEMAKERVNNFFHENPIRNDPIIYLNEILKITGKKLTEKEKEEYSKKIKNCIINAELFDGIHELLGKLKESFKLILVTNALREVANKTIDNHGIRKYFDLIIISEDVGFEKNTLKPFKIVLEMLNIKAKEIIVIGDSIEEDITPSLSLGMKAMRIYNQTKR